jgi:hypothetical protein
MLAKLADATASSALEGFTAKLRSIAQPMRQTLTYDQGKEMTRHAELTANTGVKVYFCDPHSPWQRGSCENINGLIRQYLPKGIDLSTTKNNWMRLPISATAGFVRFTGFTHRSVCTRRCWNKSVNPFPQFNELGVVVET